MTKLQLVQLDPSDSQLGISTLCIVGGRHSLDVRGMVPLHIDHVVDLCKHSPVTCLVNVQGGWPLQCKISM